MRRKLQTLIVCAFLIGASPVSHGLVIRMTDVGANPMTAAQLAAFRAAADIWELAYSDPITVNLNIAWSAPATFRGPGVLGSTNPAFTTNSYERTKLAMFFHADSVAELGAALSLPGSLKFLDWPCSPFLPGSCDHDSVPLIDINGFRNDTKVTMTTANAKALSLGTALDPVYGGALANNADGQIRFNTAFLGNFDFNRSDGITPTQTDFVTTAAHEIGHALGFFSMADMQDPDPTLILDPSTLDLRRFAQTGGIHDIKNEVRLVTAGAAEYYDGVRNNRPFSQGKSIVDPSCNTISGRCQASHWRDDLANLMDPVIPRGLAVNPRSDDLHALDYMGYSLSPFARLILTPEIFRIGFFDTADLDSPPDFGGAFEMFAPPPSAKSLMPDPKASPNLGMRLGINFGLPGLTNRSGLGLAEFFEEFFDPDAIALDGGPLPDKGEMDLFPPEGPMTTIPARLSGFSFISDDVGGVPFVFVDSFGEDGAYFDPFVGEFGGFRISGFVDAAADGIAGDVDAMLTFLLLLNEPGGLPGGNLKGVLMDMDVAMIDNGLILIDPTAFGLSVPEPGTLALMSAGLLIVAAGRRGRRANDISR